MAEGVVIKITGDDSGFKQVLESMEQTGKSALSGVETSAIKTGQALSGMATDAGPSLRGMFDGLTANAGAGMTQLIELASKAELADAKAEQLRGRLDETAAALEKTKAAAASANETFGEMQEDLSFLPQEIERLNAAIESGMRNGTMGIDEYAAAKEQIKEYEDALGRITAELPKQERTNARLTASVKKLSAEYDVLTIKLQNAELAAQAADSKLVDLGQKLVEGGDMVAVSLDDFSASGQSVGKMSEGLTGTLNTLAQGAFTEVSRKAMSSIRGMDSFGGSTLVVSAAARGLTRVLSGLMKFSGGWIALGGAAAYAAYKIYDVVSGAKDAREALKKLDETAKEWKETNIKTGYELSKGLGEFGLDKDDFKVQPARDWMAEVKRVWSDGKKETDDIVKEMVGGFTAGSDEMREKLGDIKKHAVSGGFTGDGFLAELDRDMVRLDKIDGEVEKLLKKKKNGLLSEKDQIKLQDLIDERETISIKYNLEPSDKSGFDKITQDVEAAMSRLKPDDDAGKTQVFVDAYAAATQGLGAYTDALNAEYDAQYDILRMSGQLFDEQGNKTQELIALQEWYNQKAEEGAQTYNDTIKSASEQTGVLGEDGRFTKTASELENILDLMGKAAGNTSEVANANLSNALSELDETQVVEMTAALLAMKTAAEQAGVPLDETAQSALTTLQNIQKLMDGGEFEGGIAGNLETMFGENLGNEVLEVYAALNLESLDGSWDAWVAGEHTPIVPTVETDQLQSDLDAGMTGYVLGVDGELKKIDPSTGELSDTEYRVDVDGQIYKIDPSTGELSHAGYRIGVDGELLKVDPETGKLTDTGFKFGVNGEIIEYDPATGKSSDTTYRVGLDGEILKYDPSTGETENTGYRVGLDGKVEKYDPATGVATDTEYLVGLDGKVMKYDPTTGVPEDTNYRANIPGQISTLVESPTLEKPIIPLEASVTKVNFKEGVFTDSENPLADYKVSGNQLEKFGDNWITSSAAENLTAYAEAVEKYKAALAGGDTRGMADAKSIIQGIEMPLLGQMEAGGFLELAQHIATGLQLLQDGKLSEKDALSLVNTINSVTTLLDTETLNNMGVRIGAQFQTGVSDALTDIGWETTAATVAADISGSLFLCQVGTKKILRIYKPFIGGQPPVNGLRFLYALVPFFVRRFLYAAANASNIGVTGSSLSGLDRYSNRMPFSWNIRSNLMKEEVSRLIREVSRVRIVPMS